MYMRLSTFCMAACDEFACWADGRSRKREGGGDRERKREAMRVGLALERRAGGVKRQTVSVVKC